MKGPAYEISAFELSSYERSSYEMSQHRINLVHEVGLGQAEGCDPGQDNKRNSVKPGTNIS